MTRTVFNRNNVDYTKQYMFFGEQLNTQRFDKFRYPMFNQLTEKQLGFFWRPQEVNLQKDISDFKNLQEHEKFIFTENLKFQTLLDSIVGRSPFAAFLPIVSLPELESCITAWGFFEACVHSRSYSWIVQNVYSNPSVIMDDIVGSEKILSRAKYITDFYDDLIDSVTRYQQGEKVDLYEIKKKLYLVMVNVNILEGIRFYVSFACNFALAENKLMEGSAKILSFIARDENVHMAITTTILNNWRSGRDDPDFLNIINETQETVKKMFDVVMEQEKEWAQHLFQNGSIIGLNEKLLGQYVDFLGEQRAKAIGYKFDFNAPKSNPLPWIQNWLSGTGVQEAPQETEKSSYIVGGVKQDVQADTFKDFEL